MSPINFNNEQKLIQTEVRKFATTEIEPMSADIDKNGKIPIEILKKLSGLGLLSPIISDKYGGAGLDTTSLCIIIEELSKVCGSIGLILAVNNCLVASTLLKFANEELKSLYLSRLSRGELGGFDIEPEMAGQNKGIQMSEVDGVCSLSGQKRFLLNGALANFLILNINLPEDKALCLIDDQTSGIKSSDQYLLGMKSAGIKNFTFENVKLEGRSCLVDKENIGAGLYEIGCYFNLGLSAIALGITEAALAASIKYSKERRQFGRPICEFPMVQEMLAEMKIKVETSKHLVYDAAAKFDAGENYALASKIARVYTTESAVFAGIKSVQVYGGYGYIKDYPVERYLRDAKTVQLLGESPITLKEKIARELLG